MLRWGAMAFDPPVAVLVPLQLLHAARSGRRISARWDLGARGAARAGGDRAGLLSATVSGIVMAAATGLSGLIYAATGSLAYLAMAAMGRRRPGLRARRVSAVA